MPRSRGRGAGARAAHEGVAAIARRTTRAARADGWVNALAGLGDTVRDKAAHWQFRPRGPVDPDEIGAALAEDDVTAAVAQRVPDAMLGRGFAFSAHESETQADVEAVQLELRRLDLAREAHKAATWDRAIACTVRTPALAGGARGHACETMLFRRSNPLLARRLLREYARNDIGRIAGAG